MQEILDQKWMQGPVISCQGLRIGFRANRPDLLANISSVFPPGWDPIDSADSVFTYSLETNGSPNLCSAYFGSTELLCSTSLDRALARIESHIQHTVAEHAQECLFVHAGVVGWLGEAILLPGRSYSGKSTLVRALIRAGATYFSDEFAVIDSQGSVHPFARPLSLRSPDSRTTLKTRELGGQIATEAVPAGVVVVTRYAPEQVWNPVSISQGQMMLELLRNTVAIRSNPPKTTRILKTVTLSSVAIRSLRGEAELTAPLLLDTITRIRNMPNRRTHHNGDTS